MKGEVSDLQLQVVSLKDRLKDERAVSDLQINKLQSQIHTNRDDIGYLLVRARSKDEKRHKRGRDSSVVDAREPGPAAARGDTIDPTKPESILVQPNFIQTLSSPFSHPSDSHAVDKGPVVLRSNVAPTAQRREHTQRPPIKPPPPLKAPHSQLDVQGSASQPVTESVR